MSDMSQERILQEFKRQVYLCSGIGFDAMLTVLLDQYAGLEKADALKALIKQASK